MYWIIPTFCFSSLSWTTSCYLPRLRKGIHNDVVTVLAPEGRVTYVFPQEHTAPPALGYPKTYKSAEFTKFSSVKLFPLEKWSAGNARSR